jgi:hypothetical protein
VLEFVLVLHLEEVYAFPGSEHILLDLIPELDILKISIPL